MKLNLNQTQTQTVLPRIIQTMEILQMSTLELHEHIENLLLENPVLEREENYNEGDGSQLLQKLEWLAANQRHYSLREDETKNYIENIADITNESLYDYLRSQIPWKQYSPAMCRAIECVLSGLDDNGWLEETTEELALRGGVSQNTIHQAEKIVQNLDPAGVGARSLAHCLELQLLRLGNQGLALTIVQKYLEDMARNHYNQIAISTKASREEVQKACQLIRSLDPRPGAPYTHTRTAPYVIPDVVVANEDPLSVSLAGESVPRLRICEYYRNMLHDCEDVRVKEYLSEKIRQAGWLVKSVEQRKSILMDCAICIVEQQEDFFRHGKPFLHPMTLEDVANKVGVNESTISRAVRKKYIQCAWGTFPLSDLFTRAINCVGEEYSSEQIKSQLRSMIEQEDRRKPLSDQKLCDALAKQGVTVARRTVAKYRDAMGYPSAPGRKKV